MVHLHNLVYEVINWVLNAASSGVYLLVNDDLRPPSVLVLAKATMSSQLQIGRSIELAA